MMILIGSQGIFQALGFSICSYLIMKRLKRFYLNFYVQNRHLLLCVMIGFIFTLLIRSLLSILLNVTGDMVEFRGFKLSSKNKPLLFVSIQIFDFLTNVFQLSTLVFGCIRRRSLLKKQKRMLFMKQYLNETRNLSYFQSSMYQSDGQTESETPGQGLLKSQLQI